MSGLLTSLTNSGNALAVFQQALQNIQNNIDNASTPGFAKQTLNLAAQPFDLAGGTAGGVAARGLADSRDQFAEDNVRQQVSLLGRYEGQSQIVTSLEALFDVSGTSGVAGALNDLFGSFSAWSVSPNSSSARQSVLDSAGKFANAVRGLSQSLDRLSSDAGRQIGSTVDQVNSLAKAIQQYNLQRLQGGTSDPGSDAQVHAALEQLSELTDFTSLQQGDGTITVLVAGSSPLVIGEHLYPLSTALSVDPAGSNPDAPPLAQILDAQGADITSRITGGKLGGLLDVLNRVMASIRGDSQNAGSLNRFAAGIGKAVNDLLQSGYVSSDPGAAQGLPLFTFDASNPTAAANSLALNSNITADQLAAVDSSGSANGNALTLASLSDPLTAQGKIDGVGFVPFFAQIAAAAGRESAAAKDGQQAQSQVAAQSRSLRDSVSGVSLDEQALQLLQFQRGYQAAARLVSVLNDLLQTTIDMMR